MADLAAGPKMPMNDENVGDRNNAMEAIRETFAVVRDIATAESPDGRDSQSLGIRFRSNAARVVEARQGNLPTLAIVGDPLPETLDEMLTILADVLLARGEQRIAPLELSSRKGRESWKDVARRCYGCSCFHCIPVREGPLGGRSRYTPFCVGNPPSEAPEYEIPTIPHGLVGTGCFT